MSVFLSSLLSILQAYGYPALWVSIFIAAVGLPLPIALVLLAAGAFMAVACTQQMAQQPSYRPYRPSEFFADGTSARPLPADTVARGHLRDDPLLFSGKDAGGQDATEFPFPITREVLDRGDERQLDGLLGERHVLRTLAPVGQLLEELVGIGLQPRDLAARARPPRALVERVEGVFEIRDANAERVELVLEGIDELLQLVEIGFRGVAGTVCLQLRNDACDQHGHLAGRRAPG